MPNSYFQFKQFRIEQDQAGMKVTTDGCLFGALIVPDQNGPVLDIGTGTGLITLMLAQKTSAFIDALEIDEQVAKQAKENITKSPWNKRLNVYNSSLQAFEPTKKYKQIVSNPPFFKDNALGASNKKNLAVHSDLLPMEDILTRSQELLDNDGSLWLMYPPYEMGVFIDTALTYGFHLQKQVLVRNRVGVTPIRSVCAFTRPAPKSPTLLEFSIRTKTNEYTEEFIGLLKDYYLHL